MESSRQTSSGKLRVLFICTHNSARSQIAEALLRHDYGANFAAFSAGTEKTRVKPMALRALEAAGIDASAQYSKSVAELSGHFDIVVTVCDQAQDSCPFLPAVLMNLHAGFEDPSNIKTSQEDRFEAFCQTRDEIRRWLAEQVPLWTAARTAARIEAD